jgi:hypothetical protein
MVFKGMPEDYLTAPAPLQLGPGTKRAHNGERECRMPMTVRLFVLLLSLPAVALAQGAQTPLPSWLPLPAIGGTLPPIGLPPVPDPALAPAPERRPSEGPSRRRSTAYPGVIYVVSPHPWATAPAAVLPDAPALPQTGRVHLEVVPAGLPQVFVDGVYIGTLADHQHGIDLPAGVRRIELQAAGYESVTVDVQVRAGQVITYRGALASAASRRSAPDEWDVPATDTPVALGSRTMYEIPGCYLGNVPPEDVTLPPGCDPARLRVHTP